MGKKQSIFAKIGHGFMVGLRAIGRFISQNAWIQPILVVALIFGLIFGLAQIPEIINCIEENSSEEETKIKKVTNLKNFNALKDRMDKVSTDDFIIIFGKESCSHCQDLNKFINKYQSTVGKISNLYYYDITTMMENVYDKDATKHNTALSDLDYITTKIVDKYLEESGDEEWNSVLTQNDQNASWINGDEYSLETPTTVFYLDGKLWNVVKGAWVDGEYNFNECRKILDYWKSDDLSAFNDFFKRNI